MADNIIKKPTPQEMAAAKLREIYVKAERAIIREITRKRNLGLVDYEDVASLKRVQEILTRMTTEADEYVPKMIESYFYTAEQIASAAGGYSNAMSLTVAQTSIVEQLVNNLLADIDDAAQTAFKSAENYLNVGRKEDDLFRKLALELTANKEAGVASRQTVQYMMAAELNAKGVTAFVDKAGREWSLESYCSMATRTTGRQAQVAAALTADDWDLWEIVKIGSTCPLCSAYEGRVYSKSGTDPDYPPLAMAFGKIDPAGSNDLSNTWLNLHPNCLHSLIRYTTAGKSEKQIERIKEFSSFEKRPANVDYRSKKQIEAYRNKEAERARYRADVKQFEKYKAAGVEGMPVNFETFEKHKRAGDDVYKGWESKFRSMSAKAPKVDLSLEQSAILKEAAQGAIKAATKNTLPYVDITEKWTRKTKTGKVINRNEVTIDGTTYKVDGRNVVFEHDDIEIGIAEMLSVKYGKTVELLPKVNYPQGVQVADYLIDGVRYDLKTIRGHGKDTVRDVLKTKQKQSYNFILNFTRSKMSEDEIEKQINKVFKADNTRFVKRIIRVDDAGVIKAYKKR